jgi:hypothetical protein
MKLLAAVVLASTGLLLASCASHTPAPTQAPVVQHHYTGGKLGKLGKE